MFNKRISWDVCAQKQIKKNQKPSNLTAQNANKSVKARSVQAPRGTHLWLSSPPGACPPQVQVPVPVPVPERSAPPRRSCSLLDCARSLGPLPPARPKTFLFFCFCSGALPRHGGGVAAPCWKEARRADGGGVTRLFFSHLTRHKPTRKIIVRKYFQQINFVLIILE